MSFQDLKNSRKGQFDKLNKALEDARGSGAGNRAEDKRYWKLTVDKAGNGSAIIRFLPAPQGEELPFVRYWDHGFQGPGGWYIEKSLTSIGQQDPVSEHNSLLWNSGVESEKKLARERKRRLHYISNIYVVKDPANPENDNKVFLFEYGKKIFDLINDAMNPPEGFDDVEAFVPFDLWEGANFRLRAVTVDNFRSYDKSQFDSPKPLLTDDSELENIWNMEYSLKEEVDPKNFKSYDELKARFNRVIGNSASRSSAAEEAPAAGRTAAPRTAEEADMPPWQAPPVEAYQEDDDDSLAYFKNLANS